MNIVKKHDKVTLQFIKNRWLMPSDDIKTFLEHSL